ncbi:MAG TPA: NYN domain-containing protein [Thermoanaerobaculia bacterium]|nr:NYN domain-containing protein [Thermoanaerobaculia bacterium]
MSAEPVAKRAVVFFDGQNLFHAAREAFGCPFPNYDPIALATSICNQQGWTLSGIRFYTGVPAPTDNPFWHQFWSNKLADLGKTGAFTYSRPLRYQNRTFRLPDGTQHSHLVGHEKGVDIRIALDVINVALDGICDVAVIFSQDQDFSEVADEVRTIARRQQRWFKLASAFPSSPTYRNRRGVNKTDWIRIDKATYDQCVDPKDYRAAFPQVPSAASTSRRSMSNAPPVTAPEGSNS